MRFDRKRKTLLRILVVIAIIAALLVMYLSGFERLLTILFVPPYRVLSGTELYTEQQYLCYEDGDRFAAAMTTFPLSDDADITAFTYIDYSWRDSIYFGSWWDLFVVDIRLDDQYAVVKEHILQNGEMVSSTSDGQEEIRYLPNVVPSDKGLFYVATSDTNRSIRCLYLTELDDNSSSIVNYTLYRDFAVAWDEGIGGDHENIVAAWRAYYNRYEMIASVLWNVICE